MPTPQVRDYSKPHLRAVLANPEIDTGNIQLLNAATKKDKRKFQAEVYPIVEQHCGKIISLQDFKKAKIVPHKVVRVIFQKLL